MSITDVRKTAAAATPAVTASDASRYKRPSTLNRRTTPHSSQKIDKSSKTCQRERYDDESDNQDEAFPQYCATCEKQFLPQHKSLYCSEACRKGDLNPAAGSMLSVRSHTSNTNYPSHSAIPPEPRDIIPQASPSRPKMRYSQSTTPQLLQHAGPCFTTPMMAGASIIDSARRLRPRE